MERAADENATLSVSQVARLWTLVEPAQPAPIAERIDRLSFFVRAVQPLKQDDLIIWTLETWKSSFVDGEQRDCRPWSWNLVEILTWAQISTQRKLLQAIDDAERYNSHRPSADKPDWDRCSIPRQPLLNSILAKGDPADFKALLEKYDGLSTDDFLKRDYRDALLKRTLHSLVTSLMKRPHPTFAPTALATPDYLKGAPTELQETWRYFRSVVPAPSSPPTQTFVLESNWPSFDQRVSDLLHKRSANHWDQMKVFYREPSCIGGSEPDALDYARVLALLMDERYGESLLRLWPEWPERKAQRLGFDETVLHKWPAMIREWSGIDTTRLMAGAVADGLKIRGVLPYGRTNDEQLARYLVQMEALPFSLDERGNYLRELGTFLGEGAAAGPNASAELRRAIAGILRRAAADTSAPFLQSTAVDALRRAFPESASRQSASEEPPSVEVAIPIRLKGRNWAGVRLEFRAIFSAVKPELIAASFNHRGSCTVTESNECVAQFPLAAELLPHLQAIELGTGEPKQDNAPWFGATLPLKPNPMEAIDYDVKTAPFRMRFRGWPKLERDITVQIQSYQWERSKARRYPPLPRGYARGRLQVNSTQELQLDLQPGYYVVELDQPGSARQRFEIEVSAKGATIDVPFKKGVHVRFSVIAPGGEFRDRTPACALLKAGERRNPQAVETEPPALGCYSSSLTGLPIGQYTLRFYSSAENSAREEELAKRSKGQRRPRYVVQPPAFEGRDVQFTIDARSPEVLDLGEIHLKPVKQSP